MAATDLVIIAFGIALGYHGGTVMNWAFYTYIVKEDDDDE